MDAPSDRLGKVIQALASFRAVATTPAPAAMVAALYRDLLPSSGIVSTLGAAVQGTLAAVTDALPHDQILCLELMGQASTSILDQLMILRAALMKVTGDTFWLHYNLVVRLFRLTAAGVAEARPPQLLHCMLGLQIAPGSNPAIPFLRRVLGLHALPFAPREAILNASQALRGGQGEAAQTVRAAGVVLGLIPPDAPVAVPISTLQALEQACGLSSAAAVPLVSTQFLGLTPHPVFGAETVILPKPEGDAFHTVFRRAGRPVQRSPVTVYAIENGTISFDLTAQGSTHFYVFDGSGACIEDLSWGTAPFIDGDRLDVAGDLGVLGDHFSGVMNVCHFLLDHLTRVTVYDRFTGAAPKILIAEQHALYRQFAEQAGLGQRVVQGSKPRFSVRAGRLLMSSNIERASEHPAHLAASWAIDFIRQCFGVTLSPAMPPRRRIFISRADARARQILNWDQVEPVLAAHGFEVVTLSTLSPAEQVATFGQAAYVVGVHGAGLTNIVFAPPGLRVLEIVPPLVATYAYWYLCCGAGHQYSAMVADDQDMPRPDYANWGHHPEFSDRNLVVDPTRLAQMLGQMLETPAPYG